MDGWALWQPSGQFGAIGCPGKLGSPSAKERGGWQYENRIYDGRSGQDLQGQPADYYSLLRQRHAEGLSSSWQPVSSHHRDVLTIHGLGSCVGVIIYDPELADENIAVETEDAYAMVKRLAREEGLLVGISAGANVAGALRVAKSLSKQGKSGVVVTVLCDRGDRYFAPMKWEKHYVW